MVVSKQPRLVPGSFTHVPALPPAPAAAGGDDDEPSERHSPRFQLPGPRAAPADRAPGPAAAAAPAHPRAPPRATLYLQDDEPSTSPLEWLGVGGAAGPFGWTASDGTVAREPSAAAAAPPEPLDLSEALAFELPQDSEGAKRETWLRPDGEGEASPCLEHVRKLRELSQRSAANERSLQTLMGAVQEAGVRMRRSEHEVARLSERAQDATTQQLLAHAQALLSQRSMEFQKKRQQHVALVHRLREDNRALEKIQQKIAKVRKGSGHAAVFSSSSSAKSLGNPREDSTRAAVSPLPVSGEAADDRGNVSPTSPAATFLASWISPLPAPVTARERGGRWENGALPAQRSSSPFMRGAAVVDEILNSGYSAVFGDHSPPPRGGRRGDETAIGEDGTRGRAGWRASNAFRGSGKRGSSREMAVPSKDLKAGLTLITTRSPSPALKRFGRPPTSPGLARILHLSARQVRA